MATTAANVRIGAATVYVDDYISSGVQKTTPTDTGHHKVPVEITNNVETIKIEGERSTFPIAIQATKGSASVKVVLQEITQANLATFLQGYTSGTQTVLVGDATLSYKQIKVIGPTQTWVLWRCAVASKEPIKIGKSEEQGLSITFEALYDDSVTTSDKLMKVSLV
jgi:hypothetical protein